MENAKLYKMDLYITDTYAGYINNFREGIKGFIEYLNDMYDVSFKAYNIKETDLDWQDDININYKDATEKDYAEKKIDYDEKKIEYLFRLLQEVKILDDKLYVDRKGVLELILKELVKELKISGANG